MITLEQAQAQLDALLAAESGNMLTVSIGGRTVTYDTAEQRTAQVNYWQRVVAGLKRKAGGLSHHGMSVARFGSHR
jgi:hypothetical protein